MSTTYLTVDGVRMYRWYQMGITDADDLVWLMQFYRATEYTPGGAMFQTMMAKAYCEKMDQEATCHIT